MRVKIYNIPSISSDMWQAAAIYCWCYETEICDQYNGAVKPALMSIFRGHSQLIISSFPLSAFCRIKIQKFTATIVARTGTRAILTIKLLTLFWRPENHTIHHIKLLTTWLCNDIHVYAKKLKIRGSVKNNWELSNISKTMKHNLLKFGMFIEHSYLHNSSKEWTPQRDVIRRGVILSDVILRSPFT